MEKIDIKHFVFAVTSFVFALYIICAALSLIAPNLLLSIANQWAHTIDLTKIARIPTTQDMLIGLVTSTIAAAILSALFVWIWNAFANKR